MPNLEIGATCTVVEKSMICKECEFEFDYLGMCHYGCKYDALAPTEHPHYKVKYLVTHQVLEVS